MSGSFCVPKILSPTFGVAKTVCQRELYAQEDTFELTFEGLFLSHVRVLTYALFFDDLLNLLLLEHAKEARLLSLRFLRASASKTNISSALAVIQVLKSTSLWL